MLKIAPLVYDPGIGGSQFLFTIEPGCFVILPSGKLGPDDNDYQ